MGVGTILRAACPDGKLMPHLRLTRPGRSRWHNPGMADPPSSSGGWLPPQAPGGGPAPRFDPEPQPHFTPPQPPTGPAPPPTPPAPTATFVKPQSSPANGFAIAALVLGISSLVLLVLSLGVSFTFSLPLSAAAWVCAVKAKRALRDGRAESGEGQAQAGLVLAMLGVALSVAAMVVWIALIASGFSIEDLRDSLERELDRQRERQRSSDDPLALLRQLRAAAAILLGR